MQKQKVTRGDILYSAFSVMTNQSAHSLQEFIDIILFFSLQWEHLNVLCTQPMAALHSAEGQS